MAKATNTAKNEGKLRAVDSAILTRIVREFKPEEIGLSNAWNEFYMACQAADASHELLRAIHDIKESIQDAEAVR
jgi:hypothetical protein